MTMMTSRHLTQQKKIRKTTTSIKKRPAAVAAEPVGSKVARKHVTEPVVAKGANKRSSDEDAVVPKARIMSVMPKKLSANSPNPKPVRYWGGVIYTAVKAKKFRALKVRGDAYTESSAAWGGDQPSKEAWKKCVSAIEQHYKK